MSDKSPAPVRLTRVNFKEPVRLYPPHASGRAPSGYTLESEADAVGGSGGKFPWTIYLHFDPLGRREYVRVWHADRPSGAVEVPYADIKSCEEHWGEEPYSKQTSRNAGVSSAATTSKPV